MRNVSLEENYLDQMLDKMIYQNKCRKEDAEMNDITTLMESIKVITPQEECTLLQGNVFRKSKPFEYSEKDYQDDCIRFKRYLLLDEEELDILLQKFFSVTYTDKKSISKQIDDYLWDIVKQ